MEPWHSRYPSDNRIMAHVAIQEADDNGPMVTCGADVTTDEYGGQ